jgi:hypothetical protein
LLTGKARKAVLRDEARLLVHAAPILGDPEGTIGRIFFLAATSCCKKHEGREQDGDGRMRTSEN